MGFERTLMLEKLSKWHTRFFSWHPLTQMINLPCYFKIAILIIARVAIKAKELFAEFLLVFVAL